MSQLNDLIGMIREFLPSFDDPKHELTDDSEVIVRKQSASVPAVIEDKKVVIYTKHEQGEALKNAIFENAERLTAKGQRAVEVDFGRLVKDMEPYSTLPEEDYAMLTRLRGIVPATDIPIINDALVIRRMSRTGKTVSKYTQLLYEQYGPRGINISNLVSSGYYETYVIPTYDQLAEKEGADAKDIFEDIYAEMVAQYPFAVFVGSSHGLDDIKLEIIDKIDRNLVENQHVLNIHGIGRTNIQKIKVALRDPELTRRYISDPDMLEVRGTITVKIYF